MLIIKPTVYKSWYLKKIVEIAKCHICVVLLDTFIIEHTSNKIQKNSIQKDRKELRF